MSPNQKSITVTNIDELPKSPVENVFTNPKNGETVTSFFTLISARALVRHNAARTSNSFANDLANKVTLSPAQTFYFFKIAESEAAFIKGKVSPQNSTTGGEYIALQNLFATAKGKLKRPVITFNHSEGDEDIAIRISQAPSTGRNPDCLYVKVNNEYAGKITGQGNFHPVAGCAAAVKVYLKELADNPAECAKTYGRRTGNCCFCRLELTDPRSVTAGYGPICADHWGLPWGEETDSDSVPF